MRKRILSAIMTLVVLAGLILPTFATDLPTNEDILASVSITYNVDGTECKNSDIEVDKNFTYSRIQRDPQSGLTQVSAPEEKYSAIRKGSTVTVTHTGFVDGGSYIVIFATPYTNYGSGVYEPEWTCRQWLTASGFMDETNPAEIYGGLVCVEPGESVTFQLPEPVLTAIGYLDATDIVYCLDLEFYHPESKHFWTITNLYKVDDVAVDAYLAGQNSEPSTPAPDLSYISSPSDANPTTATVLVNGEEKSFDAYSINNNNYFKLRDLAYVLSGTDKQFEVSWDNSAKAISLTSGDSYTTVGGEMSAKDSGTQTATPSSAKILLDGAEIALAAYEIGGNNYFKLRDIGQTFDFGVGWDNTSRTITIDTSIGYTA